MFRASLGVAQCRSVGTGPGWTVAWRRWVSPDVGLRWLFVWLFRGEGRPTAGRKAKTVNNAREIRLIEPGSAAVCRSVPGGPVGLAPEPPAGHGGGLAL